MKFQLVNGSYEKNIYYSCYTDNIFETGRVRWKFFNSLKVNILNSVLSEKTDVKKKLEWKWLANMNFYFAY